jgi:hypothetical protein
MGLHDIGILEGGSGQSEDDWLEIFWCVVYAFNLEHLEEKDDQAVDQRHRDPGHGYYYAV